MLRRLNACSNETVLRAVATRARIALTPLALDLFALLRSLGEEGAMRFRTLAVSCQAPPSCRLIKRLLPAKMRCFRAPHGTCSDVAMLLSLSFSVGHEDESDEDEGDESDIKTYCVNEEDSQGHEPLLLACKSGNLGDS